MREDDALQLPRAAPPIRTAVWKPWPQLARVEAAAQLVQGGAVSSATSPGPVPAAAGAGAPHLRPAHVAALGP
jgi:hypothetical protein